MKKQVKAYLLMLLALVWAFCIIASSSPALNSHNGFFITVGILNIIIGFVGVGYLIHQARQLLLFWWKDTQKEFFNK